MSNQLVKLGGVNLDTFNHTLFHIARSRRLFADYKWYPDPEFLKSGESHFYMLDPPDPKWKIKNWQNKVNTTLVLRVPYLQEGSEYMKR